MDLSLDDYVKQNGGDFRRASCEYLNKLAFESLRQEFTSGEGRKRGSKSIGGVFVLPKNCDTAGMSLDEIIRKGKVEAQANESLHTIISRRKEEDAKEKIDEREWNSADRWDDVVAPTGSANLISVAGEKEEEPGVEVVGHRNRKRNVGMKMKRKHDDDVWEDDTDGGRDLVPVKERRLSNVGSHRGDTSNMGSRSASMASIAPENKSFERSPLEAIHILGNRGYVVSSEVAEIPQADIQHNDNHERRWKVSYACGDVKKTCIASKKMLARQGAAMLLVKAMCTADDTLHLETCEIPPELFISGRVVQSLSSVCAYKGLGEPVHYTIPKRVGFRDRFYCHLGVGEKMYQGISDFEAYALLAASKAAFEDISGKVFELETLYDGDKPEVVDGVNFRTSESVVEHVLSAKKLITDKLAALDSAQSDETTMFNSPPKPKPEKTA